MPNLRPTELIIILLIIVLLFGAKKLPELAKSIGQSMKIFRAETKTDDPATQQTVNTVSDAPAPAPAAAPAPTAAPAEEENLTDDTELVSVITAAIAAYEGKETVDNGLVVRSIKRVSNRNWN